MALLFILISRCWLENCVFQSLCSHKVDEHTGFCKHKACCCTAQGLSPFLLAAPSPGVSCCGRDPKDLAVQLHVAAITRADD